MIKVIQESHATPAWATRQLIRSGGLNRFGDPNFRVTWSWNLLDWMGGKWEDRDEHGVLIREVLEVRYVPKYEHIRNRWIVEQWLAPEKFGSPQSWFAATKEWKGEGNLAQLGPYPARGRYTMLSILNDSQGRFIQLTPTVLEEIIGLLIEKKRRPKSLAEKKEEIARKEAKESESRIDLLESTIPAFNYEPMVNVL